MEEMAFALRTAFHWKMAEKIMLAGGGVARDEPVVSNFALAHTLNGKFVFSLKFFFILLTFFPLSQIALSSAVVCACFNLCSDPETKYMHLGDY